MIELLDVLNNDTNIVYRKCGEVVVAPKHNVFALYCIFCQDIFVHAQEFIRHAKKLHDDELEFENSDEQHTDIYTIEELMNGMSNNEIIAHEELEWSRRKSVKYMSENRVLKFEDGIENTDELSGMEYTEDDENSFVLCEVDKWHSQKILHSKEENVFGSNEFVSKKRTQEKLNSNEEEDNPGLDDLLNELDDDLDCIDISIIKNLRHNQTKSMPKMQTINEQICNKTVEIDLFPQIKESAENILDNNIQSNLEITEVSKRSSGHSQDCLDEWELRSNSLKTMTILEPKYKKLEETAQGAFPILSKSEYCNSPVDAEKANKKTFLEINDKLNKSSKKNILGIFKTAFTDVIKAAEEGNITKKKQNCTSLMSDNNELLKKKDVPMTKIGITKLKEANKKENNKENNKGAINSTSIRGKDLILNETTLTDEKQYNKMLKVRIKKISPSVRSFESPELNQNEANALIPKRSLRNKQCSSIKLSPIKKKSTLAGNKVAAPKTCDVIMEPASPIKNIFFKQNFTEQSIKDKALKRKNSPIEPQAQTIHSRKPFAISRQRKASIDILHETPLNNNYLDQSRTARKKQVLDRMCQIRKRITKIIDKENEVVLQPEKNKNNIKITNVAILPTIESIKTKYHSTQLHFDAFVKPKVKVKKERYSKTPTFSNVIKNNKSLDNPLKVNISSPNQMHKKEDAVGSEFSKLDLSESVLEFLQDDLCHNKIDSNQLDSILETTPIEAECNSDANLSTKNKDSSSCTIILEDLLDQVDKEEMAMEFTTISNRTIKEEPSHKFNAENVNFTKCGKRNAEIDSSDGCKTHEEIKLLSQVGLTILKTQYEILPIQEEELLRLKAKQFADILRNMPNVWQPRRLKDIHTKQLDSSFFEMTAKINSTFKINWTSIEAKRIYNLVMSWYVKQSNGKMLDKKAVSANLQYYMQLFSFLPKTGRPIYNCEFCDQQYRSEAAYSIHRCTHTGGLAYSCVHCGKGFMKSSSLKIHERSHLENKGDNKNRKAIKTENNAYLKASPKLYLENSKRSQKRFHSPENATENINPKRFQADKAKSDLCIMQLQNSNKLHSKELRIHLKREFECKLCKIVFLTAKDMSNHINKHGLNTK